jgi:hypothetical protein
MPTIEQVRYTADSGPVLPDMQCMRKFHFSHLVNLVETAGARHLGEFWNLVIAIGADEISNIV